MFMKVLLHICCAPCSAACIKVLREEEIDVTGYWYNPNIHPYKEYESRLNALKEYSKLIDKDFIHKIIKDHEEKDIDLNVFLKEDVSIPKHRHYLFELNNQLKELGAKNNKLFKELNELLEEKQISLKELINDEYQRKMENDILISNIFSDLKEFFEFSDEDLYKKTSKTEKMFMEDEVYSKMTPESKALYRKQLLKKVKKMRMSEVDCLNKLFEQTDRDDYHIGFQLFDRKSKSSNVVLYILILTLLTVFPISSIPAII